MNNQTNRRQVGRLTGRIEVDAGLMKYRELLAKPNHSVASRRRLSLKRLLRSRSAAQRRAVRVVTAALLLVVALSIGSVAQTAGIGCLYFTPGSSGSGTVFAGVEQTPGIGATIVAESSGSFELSAAGRIFLEAVARYNGELCCGPYVFAP